MNQLYIDGVNCYTTYGIFTIEESGCLSPLKSTFPQKRKWNDEHGFDINHTANIVDSRKIKLRLGVEAVGQDQFRSRLAGFFNLFNKPGLRQLTMDEYDKAYMVQVSENKAVKKLITWNAGQMIGTFDLDLIEPYPVNRQWSHSSLSGSVTIGNPENYGFTVFWGDGSRNAVGIAITGASYTYATGGSHIIVVAGRIDKASSIVATGTEIT